MKKLILMMLATIAVEAQADDFTYKYLVMSESGGVKTYLSVEDLELKFSEGQLKAANVEGNYSFSLAQLASMEFSETREQTTAVSQPAGVLNGDGPVEVFTLAGVSRGVYGSHSELEGSVPAGIYLVKQNGTTKKITVRK